MMRHKIISMVIIAVLAVSVWGVMPAGRVWAATCTSEGTGNWSATNTWSCGTVPDIGDDVIIAVGHTVTVDTNSNSIGSLTVNGTLTIGNDGTGRIVTVSGNVHVANTDPFRPE